MKTLLFSKKLFVLLLLTSYVGYAQIASSQVRNNMPLKTNTINLQAPNPSALQNQNDDDLAKDASTEINVKNADIAAIVKVFSKKTKRNYILDENVRGKVSIYLPGKVTSDEALQILESVLALKGFTSVPVSKNLWKIIPAKDAKGATIPTKFSSDENATAAVITRLVNLKYVNAEDMQQIVSQMISPNGIVNAYTGTNALIIIDSEDNVIRLLDIVNNLDVPFTNQEMTIVPIKYAEATDIAEKLKEILTDEKNNASANNLPTGNMPPRIFGQNRMPQQNQGTQGAVANINGKTVASRVKEPKIIADERTNSIILLADDETTSRIKALIDQLDSQVDLSGNRYYVYRCQHANADDLAQVLSGLNSGSNGNSNSPNPGLQKTSKGEQKSRAQERFESQSRKLGTSRLSSKSDEGIQSATLGEEVSITADPATNSLIISASKADYRKILNLLKELDVKRRQVLVEAMLLEVGMKGETKTGMEWMTSNGGKDGGFFATNTAGQLNTLFSNPSQLDGFTMAAASSGSLTLGSLKVPSQSVLLNAVANNSNVNILSAPNILTADNEEAEIVVGENLPFSTSTSTDSSNYDNTTRQIERQDVGITLRLTPRISEGDFVTLKVFTEVSSLNGEMNGEPITSVRTSETTVIAKDDQMIVIGGLMSDNNTESDSGVPFLKDIPILGHAFRKDSNTMDKKNLLIFLTPRIIRDQFDAKDATLEEKEKLEDVIAYNDIAPDRKEQLNNPRLNKVATTENYEGEIPSMITAPSDNDKYLPKSNGEILKLKASPKIRRNNINANAELPKASLNIDKITNYNIAKQNQKFIVLKVLSGDNHLPFKTSKKLFGVSLPQDVNTFAQSFFIPGSHYIFNSNGNKVELLAEGVFNDKAKAEYIYQELKQIPSSWYNLSQQEILNLGSNPWQKSTN